MDEVFAMVPVAKEPEPKRPILLFRHSLLTPYLDLQNETPTATPETENHTLSSRSLLAGTNGVFRKTAKSQTLNVSPRLTKLFKYNFENDSWSGEEGLV